MSLSYSNLPVYVGEPSASTVSETLGYIPATQVNVNYTTNSSPKRNLGVSIATGDQFKFGQGLNTTVSMTCFLQKDFEEGMSWTYYNDDFFPIKIISIQTGIIILYYKKQEENILYGQR